MNLSNFRGRQPFTIGDCGIPQRVERPYVDLPCYLPYQIQIPANTVFPDEMKPVGSDGDFFLCAISGTNPDVATAPLVRFQWPNGRFSAQQRIVAPIHYDIQYFRRSYVTLNEDGVGEGIYCTMGSYIGIEIENTTNATINALIVFEGFKRLYIPEGVTV